MRTATSRSGKKDKIPNKIESVLFIPFTPNSELKKQLTDVEKTINGHRKTGMVRMIERSGPTMAQILYNKQPWSKELCGRPNCLPCLTKPGSCRRSGVTYRVTCLTCKTSEVKSTYIGESHRSLFDRSSEHEAALR